MSPVDLEPRDCTPAAPEPPPAARACGAPRAGIAYAAALALVSAAALVVEIVAGRLLAPYVGMSLYTWTAIIAVVLAGLSAGHWLGGVLDPGDRRRSHLLLAGTFAMTGLGTALAPVLGRLLAGSLLATAGSSLAGISLLTASLFFLPSLFAGAASPVLTRLALDAEPQRRSRVLGRMFAAGALGSIAGTLAAGFVLIAWLGSLGTLLAVATVDGALALAFVAAARPGALRLAAALGAGACVVLALFGVARATGAYTSPCTLESGHFCIRVVDYTPDAGRASRLMVLDHMAHGINDRDEPRWLHSSYMALTDRLLRLRGIASAPFSAFFIGGGAYTLPRAWLHSFDGAALTVAEIDPQVTRMARERLWLAESPRLRALHADARVALAALADDERFQVIVGDAFRDLAVPAHLVTREFAQSVRDRLSADGVYVLTVIDLAANPRFLVSNVLTLEQVFPVVEVWVDARQWASGGRVTFLVLAARTPTPATRLRGRSPDDLAEARAWHRLPAAALRGVLRQTDVPVLTDDYAPVDRLMHQVMEISR